MSMLETGNWDTNDNRDTGNINDDRDTQREITDRDTNDDRDTGNINDDRETQREITDWDTGTQMTTRTQGHSYNGDAGGTGGYINDDRDTGNVRLAITINKAQGQSLEKCGIDLNTDCFPMDNYYVASSRVCLCVE